MLLRTIFVSWLLCCAIVSGMAYYQHQRKETNFLNKTYALRLNVLK